MLVKRFLDEDLKVDVEKFVSEALHRHRHTHETFSVDYTKANCVEL